jgi:hypothetical protein
VFAFLLAKGPGGVDAKLYWNTPLPTVRALTPETTEGTTAIETEGDLVAAERGVADAAEGEALYDAVDTLYVEGADSVSPTATPETPAETETAEPTFPTLSPDQRERFRRAWFESVTEFDLTPPGSEADYEGAPGAPQGAQPGAQAGANQAPIIEEEYVEEQVVEEAPVNETETTNIVVPAAPAETYQGTNQETDPFFLDAQRMQREREAQEQGEIILPAFDAGPTWSGAATTGDATTGGATTGAATSGGAWTGGATTGGAWTGGATTGGARTGTATTGGAWTGGATTGAAAPTMSGY